MELVERDAVALWWYNRVSRGSVDLDSFRMPYVDAIRDYYDSLGREMWVLDITSDLGIPVFACISRRVGRRAEDVILGFGAHFDPVISLLRAITEANQFLPSVASTNPDGSSVYLFGGQLAEEWWTRARVEDNAYLLPAKGIAPLRFGDVRDVSSDDLLADVELCVEIARRHSMELLVLDQTRPDIGLSVVKVVVPALCHFWRRLGKARLYEVPVKQGWLDRQPSEDELNPWSIFF
jgi:ribosomal protein S12 methylthiotransferase accessory factor